MTRGGRRRRMKRERRREVRRRERRRREVGERRRWWRKRWIYAVRGLCVLCFRVRRVCLRGSLGGGTSSSVITVVRIQRGGKKEERKKTYMFTKLIIIRILHLVKVVFIQLPYKGRKVGVLEHPGEYRFRKLVHILHPPISHTQHIRK